MNRRDTTVTPSLCRRILDDGEGLIRRRPSTREDHFVFPETVIGDT